MLAWMYLWRLLGGRPGTVVIHIAAMAEALGALDGMATGKRLLGAVKEFGLVEILAIDGGTWTIYVPDPLEVRGGLRRIDPPPQPDFDFGGDEPKEEAVVLAVAPGDVLRITKQEEIQILPGATASTTADPTHPQSSDPLSVDGLTELWCATCRAYSGGRKRSRARDVRPMVEATVAAGVPPPVIAEAMRTRANTLEWYDKFHARLLAAPRVKDFEERYEARKRERERGGDSE
ncbi:MAG TPA: hypothetical protein VFE62_22695 [Gemmataceae bacterium]|nr:hypothetical protein [Gemmataceae bacterium]